MNTNQDTEGKTFDRTWALVELFGHQKIAGQVTEVAIAGAAMLRVEVPAAVERVTVHDMAGGPDIAMVGFEQPAFTRFYGPGAIYSISPVSEDIARRLVGHYRNEPVKPCELAAPPPSAALAAEPDSDDHDEDLLGPGDGL